METLLIDFNIETANKVFNGEIKGRVIEAFRKVQITRILCTDLQNECNIVAVHYSSDGEIVEMYKAEELLIEVGVPDEPQFKPFDRVLVRNKDHEAWNARLYDVCFTELGLHGTQDNKEWAQCIPYEGNEHLLGTTDKPRED